MPFIIRKRGSEWCVYTEGPDGEPQGEAHGCHPTQEAARKQQAALYVHVPEARKAQPAEKESGHETPPKGYPEGRAQYADPKNYKYPLDTEKHVRAAISYFSKPENRREYSSEEQAFMWRRIRAAAARFNIELAEDTGKTTETSELGDSLVAFGGEVKALGEGRVLARLVRYTSAEEPDLDGEFFDAATDFDRDFPTKVGLYYHHGLNSHLGRRRLGRVEVKQDDAGLFFEHQLDLADAYEARIYQLAKAGKLGASSGATAHVVEKTKTGKATHLDRWPLGEASFTVTPADRGARVVALKSLASFADDPLDKEFSGALPEEEEVCEECQQRTLKVLQEEMMATALHVLASYEGIAIKEGRSLSSRRRRQVQAWRDAMSGLVGELDDLLTQTEPRPREADASRALPATGAPVSPPAADGEPSIGDLFRQAIASPVVDLGFLRGAD